MGDQMINDKKHNDSKLSHEADPAHVSQTGRRHKMDSAPMNLVSSGQVAGREAYQQANNKSKFERMRDDN